MLEPVHRNNIRIGKQIYVYQINEFSKGLNAATARARAGCKSQWTAWQYLCPRVCRPQKGKRLGSCIFLIFLVFQSNTPPLFRSSTSPEYLLKVTPAPPATPGGVSCSLVSVSPSNQKYIFNYINGVKGRKKGAGESQACEDARCSRNCCSGRAAHPLILFFDKP